MKSIDYRAGENIDISKQELAGLSLKFEADPGSSLRAIVTVFRYSTGPEVFSYSGGGNMDTTSRAGNIEALVQIVEGDRIKAVKFVRVTGSGREALLAGLTREVNKILRN